MCQIIYCIDLENIWSLKSDFSRHTVLDISLRLVLFVLRFDQSINQTLCVENTLSYLQIFMSWLMFHVLISDSLYIKELIQYLISLNVEVLLVYFSMPGPESDLIFFNISFLRYIYQKLELICSYIDTEWFMIKYLLSMFFDNQPETQIIIYFYYCLPERELISCFMKYFWFTYLLQVHL